MYGLRVVYGSGLQYYLGTLFQVSLVVVGLKVLYLVVRVEYNLTCLTHLYILTIGGILQKKPFSLGFDLQNTTFTHLIHKRVVFCEPELWLKGLFCKISFGDSLFPGCTLDESPL